LPRTLAPSQAAAFRASTASRILSTTCRTGELCPGALTARKVLPRSRAWSADRFAIPQWIARVRPGNFRPTQTRSPHAQTADDWSFNIHSDRLWRMRGDVAVDARRLWRPQIPRVDVDSAGPSTDDRYDRAGAFNHLADSLRQLLDDERHGIAERYRIGQCRRRQRNLEQP